MLLLFIHFVHNALNLHIEARQLVSKRREHTDQDQRWQVKKQLDEHVEAGVIGRILVELRVLHRHHDQANGAHYPQKLSQKAQEGNTYTGRLEGERRRKATCT